MDKQPDRKQVKGQDTLSTNFNLPLLPSVDRSSTSRSKSAQCTEQHQHRLPLLLPKPAAQPPPPRPKLQIRPRRRTHSSPKLGLCGIPQCDRDPCLLQSHRYYARTRKSRGKDEDESTTDVAAEGESSTQARISTELQPALSGATGFPALPLDETESRNPALQKLFHDFFVKLIDRLHMIVVPPKSGYSSWLVERRNELFSNGTVRRLDCLNYLGATHTYFSIRSRVEVKDDPASLTLHNSLIKTLRDVLANYRPAKDADRVISVIFTLVIESLNADPSRRSSTLQAHREAMIKIVDSRGGLHHFGNAIPFTMNLDRVLATQLGKTPLYTTWESVNLPIQRAHLYPAIYGSFFDIDDRCNEIDPEILSYCTEVDRAIEILEGEDWHYNGDPKTTSPTPEIFFLYYFRDRLIGKFAHLNARTFSHTSRDRAILLAAKVVEYLVLLDNYIAAISIVTANRLIEVLNAQDLTETWKGWEDVLQWIMSALGCMPTFWAGQAACDDIWRKVLRWSNGVGEGFEWLGESRAKQRQNSLRFVWSKTRLDEPFEEACVRLWSRESSTGMSIRPLTTRMKT